MCFTPDAQAYDVAKQESGMTSQQERLQGKIDRLQKRVEEERRMGGPKISHKSFEADDFLPDGTVRPKTKLPAAGSTNDVNVMKPKALVSGPNPIFGNGTVACCEMDGVLYGSLAEAVEVARAGATILVYSNAFTFVDPAPVLS